MPNIPTSESFNDDLYAITDNAKHNSKDALNNLINIEKTANSITNRPLPPLPQQTQARLTESSLQRVHESESDENECLNDDESEDDLDDKLGEQKNDMLGDDKKNANFSNQSSLTNEQINHSISAENQQLNEMKSNCAGVSNSNPCTVGYVNKTRK